MQFVCEMTPSHHVSLQPFTSTNVTPAAGRSVTIPLLSNVKHIPTLHIVYVPACQSTISPSIGNVQLVQHHLQVLPIPPNTISPLNHSTSLTNWKMTVLNPNPINFPDTANHILVPLILHINP